MGARISETRMLELDGSEGGGQLLRTALSLATITDTPFAMEDIRGSRPNPGLRPQHRAAVELVAGLTDAAVEGAELESDAITFEPGTEGKTVLETELDTAGSLTLLFDTLLPVGATIDGPLAVTATGGTDVKWSPTVGYLQHVKLPLLQRFGLDATVEVGRRGFYPKGGGKATLRTEPSTLQPVELTDRGALETVEVRSIASESLAAQEVAERQADRAAELLADADLPTSVEQVETLPSDCPGSSLLLRGVYDRTLVGVDELGERGRPSEEVAALAVETFLDTHARPGAVDRHMADQLVVFLAIAGGEVRIPTVTDHVETNVALVRAFGADVTVTLEEEGATLTASPIAAAQSS